MVDIAETEIRRPGRPRSAQADQAILVATLDLIAEHGIQGMSVEGVAARAGVAKTTIYRRWPNKDALVLDALGQIKRPVAQFDTGSLREDIRSYMAYLLTIISDPYVQRLSFRILGELAGRPDWSTTYFDGAMSANLRGLLGMVNRGIARGEIRADIDPELVVGIIGGPLMYYFIASSFSGKLPAFNVDQVVDVLWDGLRPFRSDGRNAAVETGH